MAPEDDRRVNRLIREKSPYLLQHAHNPVDWFPWGPEALARAGVEDKPIFLSVGYSTCHWCHVMERESFEREDVAAVLNADFVCIKVDREERPDLDRPYMAATQLLIGRGGWPNSVWLTPDGRPWYAGTYFPPDDREEQIGFTSLLRELAEAWRSRRREVEEQGDRVAAAIRQMGQAPAPAGGAVLDRRLVEAAVRRLRSVFDPGGGGFDGGPKFPPHGALSLLLYEYRQRGDASLLRMATFTLDRMARGGIRDHLAGGFHCYATDGRWLLPHFEKTLYDNAQIARSYVDAFLLTRQPLHRAVAMEVCDWVLREMTGPEGAFWSGVDADSEGREGRFYLWTQSEIMDVLGPAEGPLFCRAYGVTERGNYVHDATGRPVGDNILYQREPPDAVARSVGCSAAELGERLAAARRVLSARRAARPHPHVDDKVLAGWNGLMIGSLARAGLHLGAPRYTAAAEQAARFVLEAMRTNGRLLHTYRDGSAQGAAYLEDYAFLADALLDLHEVTGDGRHRDDARALMALVEEHYRDTAGGFFTTADDHEALLARLNTPFDEAVPSGNAAAARVLVRLADATGEDGWAEKAKACLDAFAPIMQTAPRMTEGLILAAAICLDRPAP